MPELFSSVKSVIYQLNSGFIIYFCEFNVIMKSTYTRVNNRG